MCLNKYLSNKDAMHGVVPHVHLLNFTREGVAIPLLDCRYLCSYFVLNNCKESCVKVQWTVFPCGLRICVPFIRNIQKSTCTSWFESLGTSSWE